MPIEESLFRQAMSHFPSGVTVVTTEHKGELYGMTVASFASLSLNPPLILICVGRNMQTHGAIAAARRFGVNILRSDQKDLSAQFASRTDDKFAGVAYEIGTLGVPIITDALCTLECNLFNQLDGGDHSIFVGVVEQARTSDGAPLVYFRSGYRELA